MTNSPDSLYLISFLGSEKIYGPKERERDYYETTICTSILGM